MLHDPEPGARSSNLCHFHFRQSAVEVVGDAGEAVLVAAAGDFVRGTPGLVPAGIKWDNNCGPRRIEYQIGNISCGFFQN